MLRRLLLEPIVERGNSAREFVDPAAVGVRQRSEQTAKLLTGHAIGALPAQEPHVELKILAASRIDPRKFVNRKNHSPHFPCSDFAGDVPVDCASVPDRILGPVPKEQLVSPPVSVESFEIARVIKGSRSECSRPVRMADTQPRLK